MRTLSARRGAAWWWPQVARHGGGHRWRGVVGATAGGAPGPIAKSKVECQGHANDGSKDECHGQMPDQRRGARVMPNNRFVQNGAMEEGHVRGGMGEGVWERGYMRGGMGE
eukprot:334529-Chlamydomonas_euryale.AAC.1